MKGALLPLARGKLTAHRLYRCRIHFPRCAVVCLQKLILVIEDEDGFLRDGFDVVQYALQLIGSEPCDNDGDRLLVVKPMDLMDGQQLVFLPQEGEIAL